MSLADVGVETRRVAVHNGQLDIQQLVEACDPRTRLIAVSWVGYASGWRIDVAELCRAAHERNVLVMLDAIQGLGVFPIDVAAAGVDFLAADGHKWLLGPEGAGIFYLRREHLPRLKSVQSGWNSVIGRHEFQHIDWRPRDEAARFEGGTQNMVGCIGLGASLELLQRLGVTSQVSPVADAILRLSAEAQSLLLARGAELISPCVSGKDSGILTFRVRDRDPQEIRKRALAAGVVMSVRGGGLRISMHAYNHRADLQRLCDIVFNA